MSELTSILSQYSIESIFLLLVGIGIAIKVVSELWEWFYSRVRKHFDFKTDKEKEREENSKTLLEIKDKIGGLDLRLNGMNEEIALIKQQVANQTERLQENTRSYIIDKHHYFVYKVKAIDDLNLQSLERRYMYYKSAGGDSFVDNLMVDIRNLPRINLQNETVHQHEL